MSQPAFRQIKKDLNTFRRFFTLHLRIFVFDEESICFFNGVNACYGIRASSCIR